MNKIESFFVTKVGVSFNKVFSLLLTLFLLWGFALGLLDILNNHFKEIIHANASKLAYILLTYYAGYLIMPLLSSRFAERFGYKNGIILGLMLYALGAFLVFPTSQFHSFPLFLFSMFSIDMGMAALETVVNPYTTLVGQNKYATFRITLGQSFTALGWFFGPFVGANILSDIQANKGSEFTALAVPYVGVGILVLFIAILFLISDLPRITPQSYKQLKIQSIKKKEESKPLLKPRSIFKRKHFVFAVITMMFYIAAQTAFWGFYSKYLVDLFKTMESHSVIGQAFLLKMIRFIGNTNIVDDKLYHTVAAFIFSFVGFGLFSFGRFFGSFILIGVKPSRLLRISAINGFICSILIALNLGIISFVALCLISLSISAMFPIIFSLGIRKMGAQTKRASAYLIMAIAGGSAYPILTNIYSAENPVTVGLIILIISFFVVFMYGFKGYKIDDKTRQSLMADDM